MSKDRRIVLMYPKTGIDFGSTVAPPHSLLTIAAPLKKAGYYVKVIDQRVDRNWRENLIEELKKEPICVGITSMTGLQLYFAIDIAKIVRNFTKEKVPIVWGGPHASVTVEQTIESDCVDIACVGEGEITFEETVKALESGGPLDKIEGIAFKEAGRICKNPPRPLMDIETLLPVPWELIDVEAYIHPDMYLKKSTRTLDIGQTSRGCPFNCGFCCSASLRQRKWRAMSVEKSMEVIVEPIKRFNLNGIWIRDDEFYIDRDRANRVCEGIIRENLNISWYTSGTRADVFNRATDEQLVLLKRSGAYVLKFGAESGSERILKLINKGITVEDTIKANLRAKKHGITPAFSFMVGFPTETAEDRSRTLDLVFRLKKDNPDVQFEAMATYTALPGTPMFDLALKHGLKPPTTLDGWIDYSFIDYDLEGKRIPWHSYNDRKKIGSMGYMIILSYGFKNAIDSIENKFLRYILKIFYKPIAAFYWFRLKIRWLNRTWDLMFIKFIRSKLFDRSYITLR